MADVTISQLTKGIPLGSNTIPFSNGSSTLGAPVSAIFEGTNKVGIGAAPNYNLQVVYDDSDQTNFLHGLSIRNNSTPGIAHLSVNSTANNFGIRSYNSTHPTKPSFNEIGNWSSEGQLSLVVRSKTRLHIDGNGLTTLNNGLVLSSAADSTWGQGFVTSDFGDLKSPGTVSYSVARYFGRATNTGTIYNYNHIILPFDYDGGTNSPFYSRMFCIEIKGFEYGASRALNVMFVGYSTPQSNGGPLGSHNAYDFTGSRANLGSYYSSNRQRIICRLPINNYFTSYVVNSIAVGNGRIIKPGEIEIVESNSLTI